MYSVQDIKQKFSLIKRNKFLNSQSKIDRLKSNPIKFLYIFLWQKIQSVLIYNLNIKNPFVTVDTFWGEKIKMILPRPSFLYFFGFLGKSEIYLTEYLLQNLKEGDVFVDGGANIGFYSLLASNIVGEGGTIHSFEPGKETFPVLRENAKQKRNIFCNKIALWSKVGKVSLVSDDLKNNLYGTINGSGTDEEVNLNEKVNIQAISLDEYCLKNNLIPNIIKLDTEGTEYEILKGSKNIITTNKPTFVIEILKESIKKGEYEKFISFFDEYNYKGFQLVGDYSLKEVLGRDDIDPKFYNFVFKPN